MKVLDLFEGPTLCQLATVNREGRPWVRYVMSSMDQDMVIRIPTKKETRKIDDINNSPEVHILAGRNLFSRQGAYVQIEGIARLTDDFGKRQEQWSNEMLKYFSGPSDPSYMLIEVSPVRIEYWSAAESQNPLVLEGSELTSSGAVFDSFRGKS